MAHAALSTLGGSGRGLLQADRTHIWADPGVPLEIDVELEERDLSVALEAEPGLQRDKLLALATELKTDVDKTNQNILSMDVIKKADEIEKLAHSVKERMKG